MILHCSSRCLEWLNLALCESFPFLHLCKMYILLRCVCGFDLGASNCLIYLTIDVCILSAFWWRVVTYWRDLCHCCCYFYSFFIFSADITYMAHEHIAYVVPLNMFTLFNCEVTDRVHSTSAHSLFMHSDCHALLCPLKHLNKLNFV